MKKLRLTNEDIGSVCMALYHLIHAGINVGDALSLLAEDESDVSAKVMFASMAKNADSGMTLAAVFKSAGCFPDYVCSLLDVGEQSGRTEETLNALSRYYTARAQMDRQLRSALLYPAVLLLVLLAVVVILLVWVLPVFNDVYAQLGTSLTGLAGGLLAFGTVLRKAMPVLCVILGAAVLFAGAVFLSPALRARLTAAMRRRRGDKGIWGKVNTSRFAQAFSMAISSGFAAREAGELASSLAEGSPLFRRRCDSFLLQLDGGAGVAAALRDSELLPRAECRLIEAGIKSGCSEAVMAQISDKLLDDCEQYIEEKVSKIEPALVVILCVMVGVILLSVMLPLMHIMTTIG